MPELPENLEAQILFHCEQGDDRQHEDEFDEALEEFEAAWDLLPEPKTQWELATGILAAMGDVKYLSGDYAGGIEDLGRATLCPGATGNAFIHLRRGQCEFELGNLDRAANELTLAYMGAGEEIFEDEDEKYFEFLKTRLEPPPGGW